ncbi:MAG: hypothetical protein IPP51_11060 [Bacteroidetes bacterium]|nr:hypothetical protein [Bacteroidota bacterium]
MVFPFAWRICGVDSAIHVDSSFVTTSLSLNNCSNQNRIPMEVALLDNSIISENPSHFWAQSITTSPADTPNFCFNFQINDLVYNDGVIKNLFVYLPKLPFFSTMIIDGDTMSVNTLPSGAQIFMYHAGDFGPNFTHNFTICGTLATCLTHDTTFQINYGWNCGGYPDSSQVQNHQICAEFTRNVLLQFDSTVTDFSFSNNIHYQTCRTDSVEDTLRCSSGSIRNIQLIATINDPYLSNVQYRFTYVQNGSNGVSILPDSAVVTGTNTTTFYFNTPQGSYPGYLMSGNRIIMTISFTPLQPWTAPPITVNYHYKTYCGDNEAPHSPTTLSAFQPDVGGCNSLMANANTNASLSCSYSSVVLSGSAQNGVPPLSYHWSSTPSGYSSNLASDTIHPTQTAYYILTVTDSTGATSRDSVLVNVIQSALCCIPSNFQSPPDYNLSNINAKSLGFVSLYGGAAKVLINGTFTVDTNFSFLACHNIIMGPGAVIDVLPGKTLTLNDSHIYSCTEMSQGIQAQAGSTVNLIISTIEDAQYGVLMRESSTLFSDRTNFLNDFVGIKIKPTPGIFSFNLINVYTTFRNTTFDCNRNLVALFWTIADLQKSFLRRY